MKWDIFAQNRQRVNGLEAVVVLCTLGLFIALVSSLLFLRTRMFGHDTIWYFGMIHYFYNSLANGHFPYWDIYHYCGQPFYYNIGLARLQEIPTVVLAWLNQFFRWPFLSLYHWDFIAKILLYSTGVYMALRQANRYVVSNWVAFAAFIFSSVTVTALWQPGTMTSFAWTGWAVWFFLRLRRDFTLYNMIGCAFFSGLCVSSYQAGYVLTFFQIFVLSFLVTDRGQVAALAMKKRTFAYLALGGLIVLMLSLPAVAVYLEKDKNVPILRKIASGENIYESSVGAGPLYSGDYVALLAAPAAGTTRATISQAPFPLRISECPLYIGIVPFFLAVAAAFSAGWRKRGNFLVTLGVLVFLSCDGKYLLGPVAPFLFPFLKYCRLMELFQPFVVFMLVFLVGQGMDMLCDRACRMSRGTGGSDHAL